MKIRDPHRFNGTEQEALDFLGEYVPYPELYKNDYGTWETAMFNSYDDIVEDDVVDEDISLTKQEYEAVHNALENNDYAYFVRNFTAGDDEESRHENEIDQSLEYFQDTYDVGIEQAAAMKFLVDDVLKPNL